MLELFILILVICYFAIPDPVILGVTNDELWKCICYPLAHASKIHLIMNCLSLSLLARPVWFLYTKRFGHNSFLWFLSVCYVGSVLAAIPMVRDVPTVGASGICYFMLGVLLALHPTLKQLKAYVFVFLCIILQALMGHSNVNLHLVAFVYGILFVVINILHVRFRNREY